MSSSEIELPSTEESSCDEVEVINEVEKISSADDWGTPEGQERTYDHYDYGSYSFLVLKLSLGPPSKRLKLARSGVETDSGGTASVTDGETNAPVATGWGTAPVVDDDNEPIWGRNRSKADDGMIFFLNVCSLPSHFRLEREVSKLS